jgi:hypothetical protein
VIGSGYIANTRDIEAYAIGLMLYISSRFPVHVADEVTNIQMSMSLSRLVQGTARPRRRGNIQYIHNLIKKSTLNEENIESRASIHDCMGFACGQAFISQTHQHTIYR